MAQTDTPLVVQRDGEITSVRFVDRNILEEARIQEIGEHVGQLIDAATSPKLLLDFTGVEHLSSAALGALININNRIRKKGGQLRLAGIHSEIYEVFAITKLNKLFQIHEDAAAAKASFK